ncbi:MAG: outer membrane beta-barrel protein [Gemmatimonadetes bacterium]|nr:outer membrane beta-barrel protein [Gemmatimonadota bacterium]
MTAKTAMRAAPGRTAGGLSLERIFVWGAALAVFTGMGTAPAAAQDEGFLFGTPKGSLALKVGYHVPRAQSDLFVFTQNELTVEDGDFNGMGLAGELGVRISERLDLTASVGFSESRTRSEFREWEDESGFPIEQETRFSVVPLTVGFKTYLGSRGRRVGRLAWVPSENKVNPFVGGAVGVTYYQFEQFGDFIDFETLDIFPDNFYSEGTAPTVHVLGGVDVTLSPRVYFTAEGRYGWASAPLDRDFVGFEDLDLAGFQGSVGIGFRF